MNRGLAELVPGGSHTYSKSDDCFPANAPKYISRGKGCYVQDHRGKRYLDWGMGLRSVILGHSYESVNHAVIDAVVDGVNHTRPTLLEWELAEKMVDIIPSAEMVKFGKSGSDVTSAAVKLARAYTGRKYVLIAAENPFISQHDWFISKTELSAGIPIDHYVRTFCYNRLGDDSIWSVRLSEVAAIVLDPSTVDITKEKLQFLRDLCDKNGIVFILDEMISGFRYGLTGVQGYFGITPDLSTFGKAMGNGFSISALCGKREIMQLGDRKYGDVFLLSGTFNAETTGLAAALATISEMQNIEPCVVQKLNNMGRQLVKGINEKAVIYGLEGRIKAKCFSADGENVGCNPSMTFSNMDVKTLFDQHMVECQILMPYIAPSYSHGVEEIEKTLNGADYAMKMIVRAIENKRVSQDCMDDWHEKPVFRKLPKEV
jgi:glutamate-1-semialdehyde 2,1-aminomutase